MKPSTPTSTATKSISSSSSSSKSKNKKTSSSSTSASSTSNQHSSSGHSNSSTQHPITARPNLNHINNSNDHPLPSSSNRDRNSQRSYVGINANAIKSIWDQYKKNDTELNSDILPVLAEDASYKLWEFINNLKTFTRHSGGKLTTSIVSELLKDCNVPPAIGSFPTKNEWTNFDLNRPFFYNEDDDENDLRERHLRKTTMTQLGPITLEANWVSNQRNFKDLTKLWQNIMLAIVLGDDAAFQYTIHTTLINPFIGCILPYLVQKTIEYLAFGCTDDTLDRLLRFLKVLVQNYHSRDVANNEQYFNLCNLFVCLLRAKLEMQEKIQLKKVKMTDKKPLSKKIKKEMKGSKKIKIKSEPIYSKVYLSYGVNPIALKLKNEAHERQKLLENKHINESDATKVSNNSEIEKNSEKGTNSMSAEDVKAYCKETFSQFVTVECADRFVDEVCKIIGYLAAKWGYFEHETTYLIAKHLEIFFYEKSEQWTKCDFKWLGRIIQALAALGETAFRELTLYFELIPYEYIPEWLIPHFSYCAIYIRSRKDFYFYEYIQEVCGDSLVPFLTYYSRYVEKKRQQITAKQKNQRLQTAPYKICSKLMLKLVEKTTPSNGVNSRGPTTDDLFPDRSSDIRKIAPSMRKIGFKYTGCGPVLTKSAMKSTMKSSAEPQLVQSNKLNKQVVICRRKMLKPIYLNKHVDLSILTDKRQYNI